MPMYKKYITHGVQGLPVFVHVLKQEWFRPAFFKVNLHQSHPRQNHGSKTSHKSPPTYSQQPASDPFAFAAVAAVAAVIDARLSLLL